MLRRRLLLLSPPLDGGSRNFSQCPIHPYHWSLACFVWDGSARPWPACAGSSVSSCTASRRRLTFCNWSRLHRGWWRMLLRFSSQNLLETKSGSCRHLRVRARPCSSAPCRARTYWEWGRNEDCSASAGVQKVTVPPGVTRDLREVIEAWDELPHHVRVAVLLLVRGCVSRGQSYST